MKTKAELINALEDAQRQGVQFVTYGDGDLGIPMAIDEAIRDFESFDDDQIGEGTWYVCDSEGKVL